ncbi:MAG: LegC family aminotransferase [Fidelibacterota bacterium]|nr:MAG: LegC family aminotransferase [Candidatus Neomarinimicrobiota bacterium]
MIPLTVPELRGNEWKYIKECLDTNWVSSAGRFVDRFEASLAEYIGIRHAVATVNGTAALHMALLVAGIEPDDEVLVPSLTFIAPANAVRYVGAWPVFMDVEPTYWQMDSQKVLDFLEGECQWRDGGLYNKATDRRVKAALPVHILGHPVDMDPLMEVARKYGLVIIEDATESLGAKYKGRMVGSMGEMACFSFNGNKIITTGGGGMVATNREEWAQKIRYYTTQAKDDPQEYVHREIGYNYRLTNIQAALGCAQLEQLNDYIAQKRQIADAYSAQLKEVPGIQPMLEAPWADSIFWLFTVLVDESQYGMDSRSLMRQLEQEKIQARPLWQPLHLSPAHKQSMAYRISVAEEIHRKALSLPCSVGVGMDDIRRVAETVIKIAEPK